MFDDLVQKLRSGQPADVSLTSDEVVMLAYNRREFDEWMNLMSNHVVAVIQRADLDEIERYKKPFQALQRRLDQMLFAAEWLLSEEDAHYQSGCVRTVMQLLWRAEQTNPAVVVDWNAPVNPDEEQAPQG